MALLLQPVLEAQRADVENAEEEPRNCDDRERFLGADQHASFRRWHRPAEVKRLARLAVFTRPGYPVAPSDATEVRMTPLAISGSDIRARAARGESVQDLVPPAVANYIVENKIYR